MKRYTYLKWTKDDYKNVKSYYNDLKIDVGIKDEIEKEIITREEENKKSICNERILSRDMIIQTNVNPFLLKNSYIEDLEKQDKFLRPMDSNIKKKK